MTRETLLLTVAVVVTLVGLILIRVPVAFALLIAATGGLIILDGVGLTAITLARQPYNIVSKYTYIVIPLFVAMGMFASRAGLAQRAYALVGRSWLGKLPGGMGIATVLSAAGFGAVSGSSVATVATIGRISISEMLRHRYNKSFAAAIVVTASTLGILIPPSIALVFIGLVTGESIGALLIAGIVPGALSALVLCTLIILRARRRPELVGVAQPAQKVLAGMAASASDGAHSAVGLLEHDPASSSSGVVDVGTDASEPITGRGTDEVSAAFEPMSRAKAIGTFTEITGIFVVVIGGIYFGFVTATEAAGLGALAALVVMIGERFSAGGRALAKDVGASLLETLHVSAMLFALMVGAGMLSHYMVLSGVSSWLVNGVSGLDVAPIFIVIGFLLILIPLGMILDGFAMLLITLPLAYPVVTSLGYDGIWFGILMVKMIEFGLITPPVGMNLFVLSGVRKDITVQDTVRGLMPFYIAEAVTIAVLVAFPAITLFLPQSAGY